jgi:hypothetical protein
MSLQRLNFGLSKFQAMDGEDTDFLNISGRSASPPPPPPPPPMSSSFETKTMASAFQNFNEVKSTPKFEGNSSAGNVVIEKPPASTTESSRDPSTPKSRDGPFPFLRKGR